MDYSRFLKVVEEASEIEQYTEGFDARKDVLISKWISGGKGYTSWEGAEIKPELEPRYFIALDLTLEELWPEITLLEYNRLCRCLIRYGEDVDESYYGETTYNVKYVVVSELYDFLRRYDKV
jgi:hypothetical protein